ncbi:MAG: Ig-like domain-containing protein [Pirellulales bacterium]
MVWQLNSRAARSARRPSARGTGKRRERRLGLERLEARQVLAAFTPGNLLVSSSPADQPSRLYEFTPAGVEVQSTNIPNPSVVISERARDLVFDSRGQVAVYNGTYDPRLSTYDPVSDTWTHAQLPYWSTGNNISFGGLAALNNFVIGTDMRVRSEPAGGRGLVQFNVDNLDSGWTRNFDANIGDALTNTSLSIPHVSIQGTGDGSFDYYSFTVATAGARGIFDVDGGDTGGPGSFHSYLRLFDSAGNLITSSSIFNDPTLGQGGSATNRDAYLEYTFAQPGQYLIEVGGCCTPEGVPHGAAYSLQVSLTGHSTYVPGGDGTLTEVEPNDTIYTAQNADSAERFSADGGDPMDVAVGLNGLIYALMYTGSATGGGNIVKVFDPADFSLLRTIVLPQEHRAIAVDLAGHIYATQPGIYHYDANGVLLSSINNPVGGFLSDIDIKPGGCTPGVASYPCLAIASNNGYIVVTTTALDDFDFFLSRASDSQTFVAFVDPPLDLPRATDDVYRVREDSVANTLAVLVNDLVDSRGVLSITAVGAPSQGGSVRIVGGRSLQYSPAADFAGVETFEYTVSDGLGSTSQATVTIEVSNVNENPHLTDDTFTVFEDSTNHLFDVLSNDTGLPDVGETLHLEAAGPGSAGGSVTIEGNLVRYTPAADFAGDETFPYTVTDGNGGVSIATVTVTVLNLDDPPTATNDAYAINPNTANNPLDVLGNDSIAPDAGETLIIASATTPAHGLVAVENDVLIRYTPDAGYLGPDSFTYTLRDSSGSESTATVNITVTVVNNPPLAGADNYQISRNSTANRLRVLVNDTFAPDINEVLTITGVSVPNRGGQVVVTDDNTVLRYTPAPQFAGVETFTYTITDGRGAFDHGTVTITVGDFNSLPLVENDAFTVRQSTHDNLLDVLLNDIDPDGTDILTIQSVGPTSSGGLVTITPDGLSLLYTPPTPFLGTETFTYLADDGHGGVEEASVTITVVGWQNPDNRLDVDPNPPGVVSPSDAAVLVNEINFPTIIGPGGLLPPPPVDPRYFYDVTGDGYLTPLDVLLVIEALNFTGSGEGELAASRATSATATGEGEAAATDLSLAMASSEFASPFDSGVGRSAVTAPSAVANPGSSRWDPWAAANLSSRAAACSLWDPADTTYDSSADEVDEELLEVLSAALLGADRGAL